MLAGDDDTGSDAVGADGSTALGLSTAAGVSRTPRPVPSICSNGARAGAAPAGSAYDIAASPRVRTTPGRRGELQAVYGGRSRSARRARDVGAAFCSTLCSSARAGASRLRRYVAPRGWTTPRLSRVGSREQSYVWAAVRAPGWRRVRTHRGRVPVACALEDCSRVSGSHPCAVNARRRQASGWAALLRDRRSPPESALSARGV